MGLCNYNYGRSTMYIEIYDNGIAIFDFDYCEVHDNRKAVSHDSEMVRKGYSTDHGSVHAGTSDEHNNNSDSDNGWSNPAAADRIYNYEIYGRKDGRKYITFHGIEFEYDEYDYYNYNEDTRYLWKFGDFLASHWQRGKYSTCNRSGCICNWKDND